MKKYPVYIEEGVKKTFAGSIDWPGWARYGKDQESALSRLFQYGPRYAQVLKQTNLDFKIPDGPAKFTIKEVVKGNSTTSFGAPAIILESDHKPANKNDYDSWRKILSGCWNSFDFACQRAADKELKKGPRGGGRDLDRILSHIIDGDVAYLKKTALSYKPDPESDPFTEIDHLRKLILDTLERSEAKGLPEKGPRGGQIWPVRFFVRRVIWHTLDHLWEIEDRIIE